MYWRVQLKSCKAIGFFAAITLFSHTALGNLSTCAAEHLRLQKYFEVKRAQIDGKDIDYYQLPEAEGGGTVMSLKKFFPNSKDEVILCSMEFQHYCTLIGTKRYKAELLGVSKLDDNPLFVGSPGIYVRFPDLPHEKVQSLLDNAEANAGKITATCVHGSCRVLEEGADIHVGGGDKTPSELVNALERILTEGFVDTDGKPIEYQIFVNSKVNLEKFLERLKDSEKRLLKDRGQKILGRKDEVIKRAFKMDPIVEAVVFRMKKELEAAADMIVIPSVAPEVHP